MMLPVFRLFFMPFSRFSGALDALASSAASPFRAHSMTPDRLTAEAVAEQLQLDGHVEGGFFRRTYASDYRLLIPDCDERLSITSIFYLLAA